MDIPSIGATANATSNTVAGEASLADSFDTFLTLLTTQLQNQDPLNPMDSTEFTNQLVQFSEVEQSINTNKNLKQLVSMQNTNQAVASLGYIGNKVEAVGNQMPLVNGNAEMTYTLPENANSANILILDQAGQLVRSIPGETSAGKHTVTWDGTASNGAQLPDGLYNIAVSAQSADKDSLDVKTNIVGTVTGTQNDENGAYLTIGPLQVGLGQVVAVTKPQTAQN